MQKKVVAHEATYKKKRVEALIHNNRLNTLLDLFKKYLPSGSKNTQWADFGCSNGFICEEVGTLKEFNFSKIVGFDHVEKLLDTARQRNIPNAEFRHIDLNKVYEEQEQFDLVSCFETLEHVGDYRNAFRSIFNAVKDDGLLFVAVPNETGIAGLIKFLGRYIVRKKPYADFFDNKSPLKYAGRLLTNGEIEDFRQPNELGYGPHLGFDHRILEEFFTDEFISNNKLNLVEKFYTSFHMNVIYVLKKQSKQEV